MSLILADAKTSAIGPGLLAFLIVVALGIATFFLVRSMLNQIKKVPPTFDEDPSAATSAPPSTDSETDD